MSAGDDAAFQQRLLELAEAEAAKPSVGPPPTEAAPSAPLEDLLQDLLTALRKEGPPAVAEAPAEEPPTQECARCLGPDGSRSSATSRTSSRRTTWTPRTWRGHGAPPRSRRALRRATVRRTC